MKHMAKQTVLTAVLDDLPPPNERGAVFDRLREMRARLDRLVRKREKAAARGKWEKVDAFDSRINGALSSMKDTERKAYAIHTLETER